MPAVNRLPAEFSRARNNFPGNREVDLKNLLDDAAYWREQRQIGIIESSVILHHRAVTIRPFENGNGRWARRLANIWLKQAGTPVVAWPEQTFGVASPIRDRYLFAICTADDGDYGPLIDIHKRCSS